MLNISDRKVLSTPSFTCPIMVIHFERFRHILPFTFVHLSLSGVLSLCSFSRTFTSSTNPSGNILSIGNAGDGEFCCAVFMWFITFPLPKLAPWLLINKLLRTNNINREEERSHICDSNIVVIVVLLARRW